MYALTPEKFVAIAAFGPHGLNNDMMLNFMALAEFLLDLCSLGGLAAMLVSEGVFVPALAVSYGATGMAALVALWAFIDAWLFGGCCTGSICCWCYYRRRRHRRLWWFPPPQTDR